MYVPPCLTLKVCISLPHIVYSVNTYYLLIQNSPTCFSYGHGLCSLWGTNWSCFCFNVDWLLNSVFRGLKHILRSYSQRHAQLLLYNPARARIFCCLQTGLGVHPAFCSVGARRFFPGCKAIWTGGWLLISISYRDQDCIVADLHCPARLHSAGLN